MEAAQWFEASLASARRVDDQMTVAMALSNLGTVAAFHGNWRRADDFFEQALILKRSLDAQSAIVLTLNNLADSAIQLGEIDQAAVLLEEAVAICECIGDQVALTSTLVRLGSAFGMRGEHKRGVTTATADLPGPCGLGTDRLSPSPCACWVTLRANGCNMTALPRFTPQRSRSAKNSVSGIWFHTISSPVPRSPRHAENSPWATQLCGGAAALVEINGSPMKPIFQRRHDSVPVVLHDKLSTVEFDAAWAVGFAHPDVIVSKAVAMATSSPEELLAERIEIPTQLASTRT